MFGRTVESLSHPGTQAPQPPRPRLRRRDIDNRGRELLLRQPPQECCGLDFSSAAGRARSSKGVFLRHRQVHPPPLQYTKDTDQMDPNTIVGSIPSPHALNFTTARGAASSHAGVDTGRWRLPRDFARRGGRRFGVARSDPSSWRPTTSTLPALPRTTDRTTPYSAGADPSCARPPSRHAPLSGSGS